ncbi:MAG TPA: CocE/NonD family hydrolase, partial [Vicinamibacterales bacterium]|nr:CocE/NonD family hydrolase [Vicinamibacterales bacterium]
MKPRHSRIIVAALVAISSAATLLQAQQGALSAPQRQQRIDTENELQSLAIVDRKVMMAMPDGVRLATDIYRPKNSGASSKVPIVFVRTPYNFNFWDVHNGVPADMTAALTAVKRGYAYVVQNERGHFFSEGNYDILGAPPSDGYNAIDWLTKQPWSNGKLGTTGCSSTAEYQMAIAALGHPGYAAMNTQGFGAGVGRVAPYYEQGNWYRGGAMQMLFITWIYGEQNQVRPMFPPNTSREDLIRASKSFDLAQHLPPVDWSKALWHLPVQDIIKNVDGPRGIFESSMPVETGGKMIQRAPNDPAWYRGGLYHDDQKL